MSEEPTSRAECFRLLGLPYGAAKDDIKTAYKDWVKKLHPDCNGGDQSGVPQFRKINAAYAILMDKGLSQSMDGAARAGHGADFFMRIMDEMQMFWQGWMRVGAEAAALPLVVASAQTACFMHMCSAMQELALGMAFPGFRITRKEEPPMRDGATAPSGRRDVLRLEHAQAA